MPQAAEADGTPTAGTRVAVRTVQPVDHVQMIVAVQHQLGAVRGNDVQQDVRVDQPLVARRLR